MTTAGTERPPRPGPSVRVRITTAVALLVALGLTLVGLLLYGISVERMHATITEDVEQEIAEFQTLQAEGLDPETGEPFRTIRDLLDKFLSRNVPDDDELLVGWIGDRPVLYSEGSGIEDPRETLLKDSDFLAAVDELVASGGTDRVTTEREGELLVAAQPVAMGDRAGGLVVISYVERERTELRELLGTYAVVAVLTFLLITGLAAWQSGRLLAPLRTLRSTADEISESDLSRRIPETGNDDITALSRTVNGMLDRLEAAFGGQRRFLDDAGHELKTPLTVLRGHLELLDTGSPEEVEETKALLLDEVDRMSRLVGDLILLAKSDRPDFLTPTEVDPADLVSSALAKVRALGERDWRLDHATHRPVRADEQRLTQALLQLADNAVKHTSDGDQIALGSSYDGSSVRLWVRDTGPGVPAEHRELIFERFGRSTVAEHDEGFGLGLSIVRAIATAHGGEVTVETPTQGGARFVITLPADPPTPMGDD